MRQAQVGDTVRVHYTAKLEDGTVFDSSQGGSVLEFKLGSNDLIRGFHQAVLGMKPGDSKTEKIPSELGYGPHQESLCVTVDPALFVAEGVHPDVGMELEVRSPDGNAVPVRVTEVSEVGVTLDANHPLAGKDLIFDIDLVEIVDVPESSSRKESA
ncbi:FKBP-type peptidyl-prolyl cis-trans isomerase [Candidatus Nitrospira bockiana]